MANEIPHVKYTHIVQPITKYTHTIILLHGRDSDAVEFANEFFESQASNDLTLPEIFPSVKWVFPDSALRKSERFGQEMKQWFDMWSTENPREREDIQKEGMQESVKQISEIVKEEAEVVGAENIILGGISQGCAVAVHVLASLQLKIGGIGSFGGFIGFCSWLALPNDFFREAERMCDVEQWKVHTPVFLAHCKDDEVVPIANGDRLCTGLRQAGFNTSWRGYEDGGHWINEPEGVDDVAAFLQEVMCKLKSI
ncbi:Alpha/Beta hydrolase protein [Halenospora varia]|nr:Alpha/Beta hydrolase protein [Halenospora varia]